MTRQFDITSGRMAREAELWRRIRALDRYVLGEPTGREAARGRRALCFLLFFALAALSLWVGLFMESPADGGPEGAGMRTAWSDLATAILIKLLAAAFLAVCVLHRHWILAGLNLIVVVSYVIATAMGVFDTHAVAPVASPPETASEGTGQ